MCLFSDAFFCVYHVKKEQKQEKTESLNEEMVELRTWNQQKDNCEDDTQVLISQLQIRAQ